MKFSHMIYTLLNSLKQQSVIVWFAIFLTTLTSDVSGPSHIDSLHSNFQFQHDVCSHVYIKLAIAFGHHEGLISSHVVTKLVLKGPSHEPHSKLTCPFSSGTEGSTTRFSKMTPVLAARMLTFQIISSSRPRSRGL